VTREDPKVKGMGDDPKTVGGQGILADPGEAGESPVPDNDESDDERWARCKRGRPTTRGMADDEEGWPTMKRNGRREKGRPATREQMKREIRQ
jgi:hypothetical protein